MSRLSPLSPVLPVLTAESITRLAAETYARQTYHRQGFDQSIITSERFRTSHRHTCWRCNTCDAIAHALEMHHSHVLVCHVHVSGHLLRTRIPRLPFVMQAMGVATIDADTHTCTLAGFSNMYSTDTSAQQDMLAAHFQQPPISPIHAVSCSGAHSHAQHHMHDVHSSQPPSTRSTHPTTTPTSHAILTSCSDISTHNTNLHGDEPLS